MYKTRTYYEATCDVCNKEYGKQEGIYIDDKYYLDVAAFEDNWKVWKDEDGAVHHRCPAHWEVTCRMCGTTTKSSYYGKELEDWSIPECDFSYEPDYLCPECAEK